MDYLKELLGFVALSGPLLLIIIWLPVAIWLAKKSVNRIELKSVKIGGGLLVFLLIFLIPFADVIIGRIYLSHLCATETEVKVYQTIRLSEDYWKKGGEMKFLKPNGNIDQDFLDKEFIWRSVSEPYSSRLIKINKKYFQFIDKDTQKILAERTSFWWHGGWLSNFSTAPTSGKSCPLLSEQYSGAEFRKRQYEREHEFYSKIFIPVNSKLEIQQ